MKIRITQEDIDNGIPGNSCKCPTALAVCRTLGVSSDADIVDVTDECVQLNIPGFDIYWGLDDTGIAFVDYFDNHTPVHPVEFEAYPVIRVVR